MEGVDLDPEEVSTYYNIVSSRKVKQIDKEDKLI